MKKWKIGLGIIGTIAIAIIIALPKIYPTRENSHFRESLRLGDRVYGMLKKFESACQRYPNTSEGIKALMSDGCNGKYRADQMSFESDFNEKVNSNLLYYSDGATFKLILIVGDVHYWSPDATGFKKYPDNN